MLWQLLICRLRDGKPMPQDNPLSAKKCGVYLLNYSIIFLGMALFQKSNVNTPDQYLKEREINIYQ